MLATTPTLKRVITCTTRPPRPCEHNGVDYWFLDTQTFSERLATGAFLEHATVYGHMYGTPHADVNRQLREGSDLLLAIDVQGASTVRRIAQTDPLLRSALITVFLTPPTIEKLEERLLRRGQDSAEVVASRLAAAQREISEWPRFDYLVVSTTIDEDLRRMQAIYLAEKMRSCRAVLPPH